MSAAEKRFAHVLLVDDSEIDVLVNRRLIELTGFAAHTTVAYSSEQALHFLREECATAEAAPDWIFLDVNLPMMDGLEFLDQFLLLPDYIRNKTRVLLLTVIHKPEVLEKLASHPQVRGQVEKPLTRAMLTELAETGKVIPASF